MTARDGDCVVLGVGNVLVGDDGAGVHAARELERRVAAGEVRLPAGARIVDGGTLGLDLAPWLAGARAVVLLDAVDVGDPPGTVAVVGGATLAAWEAARDVPARDGVGGLLGVAALAGLARDAIALVGIQVAEPRVGPELSGSVRAAVPVAAALAAETLVRLAAGTWQPTAVAAAAGVAEEAAA